MGRHAKTREEVNEEFEKIFKQRDELMKRRKEETDGNTKDMLTRQISKLNTRISQFRRSPLLDRKLKYNEQPQVKFNPKPMLASLQAIEEKAKEKIKQAQKRNDTAEVKRIQEALENVKLKLKYEYCSI